MTKRFLSNFSILFFVFLLLSPKGLAQYDTTSTVEQHRLVSMRLIGHSILLLSDDSVSRVLPIQRESNRYIIQFEKAFLFNPSELYTAVDSVINLTRLASKYIVEAKKCETGEVVYSYEVDKTAELNLLTCSTRTYPKDCYTLCITILDSNWPMVSSDSTTTTLLSETITLVDTSASTSFSYFSFAAKLLLGLYLLGLIVYFIRKRRKASNNPNILHIGKYVFDKRSMVLSHEGVKVELSGKEADLLNVLYTAANSTIEREVILKSVWGDEGDYVGRTLDVFISKLRKRLENDANIKIINIRGVGYKLVMDGSE